VATTITIIIIIIIFLSFSFAELRGGVKEQTLSTFDEQGF